MENPRNHFTGAVVTHPMPDAPAHAAKHMLIDGQQRLTTLFILPAVIRDHAKADAERWSGLAEEIQDMCLTTNSWTTVSQIDVRKVR